MNLDQSTAFSLVREPPVSQLEGGACMCTFGVAVRALAWYLVKLASFCWKMLPLRAWCIRVPSGGCRKEVIVSEATLSIEKLQEKKAACMHLRKA